MLLIKNGKVLTMGPQGVLEQADVLIGDDGKIIEVAENLEASGQKFWMRAVKSSCRGWSTRIRISAASIRIPGRRTSMN